MLLPLLLFAAANSAAPADMTPPASAELCGRCHRGIHEAWKTSSHAQAMESRLFQEALADCFQRRGNGAIRAIRAAPLKTLDA